MSKNQEGKTDRDSNPNKKSSSSHCSRILLTRDGLQLVYFKFFFNLAKKKFKKIKHPFGVLELIMPLGSVFVAPSCGLMMISLLIFYLLFIFSFCFYDFTFLFALMILLLYFLLDDYEHF